MSERVETLVIGAGLSGLSCAVRLHEAGREVRLLEASDEIGGRVATDEVDGFLLDRGFQVYLDAYPQCARFLDLPALDLRSFEPGALVWKRGRLRPVMDPFRRPASLLSSAIQPVGTPLDKGRVAFLRRRILDRSLDEIWAGPDMTTADYLRERGFSEGMIDDFFRGFYGGIFLENQLVTSSRMFEFTFRMFALGSATLPAGGMRAIPRQLAERLPGDAIRLSSPVESVDGSRVSTAEESFEAANVVIATDGETASRWIPELAAPSWNGTSCLQFDAPEAPVDRPIIVLRGDRAGLVNNLCVPSNVQPAYAPEGRALVSVSTVGDQSEHPQPLAEAITTELRDWFGPVVDEWRHLRTDHIRRALPAAPPGRPTRSGAAGPIVCGDHTTTGSIEGAVTSGLRAADRILFPAEA